MNSRRRFFRDLGIAGTFLVLPKLSAAPVVAKDDFSSVKDDRAYWLKMLERVAGPVLSSLAAGKLRERMPVECPAGDVAGRRKVTHLEAIGRTLSGIAPWLELADKTAEEAELERHFADFARRGLAQATNPQSPDYINFTGDGQCLVDAAFLSMPFCGRPAGFGENWKSRRRNGW